MTAVLEDKILKTLGVVILLGLLPLSKVISASEWGLYIIIPLLVILSVLILRKYLRDKSEGKDGTRYKLLLFFLAVSSLIFCFGF